MSGPSLACGFVALLLPISVMAQQITVSAAASLTEAFRALAPRFEAAMPGASVRFNFASSGALLQQIRQGAPVDVFASADQVTMDRAADESLLVPGSRVDFAANEVVMIEPAQGGLGLKSLADLADPQVRRIAVGKVATVPAGRYTRQILEDAGAWKSLTPKLVQADSVRQVLDYVSRGEVEAGFVYRTDAALMPDKVKVVLTALADTPVAYPVAIVRDSRQKATAAGFVSFLSTSEARLILAGFGFGAP